jgi:hypothetical protein
MRGHQRKIATFNEATETDNANGILDGVPKIAENSLLTGSLREPVHSHDRIHQRCSSPGN